MRAKRAILLGGLLATSGCFLSPLRIYDAPEGDAAQDSVANDGTDGETDASDVFASDASDAADSALDAPGDTLADVASDDAAPPADAALDATPDAGDASPADGSTEVPLGMCAGSTPTGVPLLGPRPVWPWSNRTITSRRTTFTTFVETGWTAPAIVVVNARTNAVAYTATLTGGGVHMPPEGTTFANGVYRWRVCARNPMGALMHSAEWRFRVSAVESPAPARAGSVPAFSDMTGDGVPEVVYGAPESTPRGTVRVLSYATATTAPLTQTITGGEAGDGTGSSVALLGDVNGDDLADLAVGSPNTTVEGMTAVGLVTVFHGTGNRASPLVMNIVLRRTGMNFGLGRTLAGVGDINGDGLDDLAVGAPTQNADRGQVRLHFGTRDGLRQSSDVSLTGVNFGDAFGWSLSGIGDINGDGVDDFAVGALRGDATAANNAGSVAIYLGDRRSISMTPLQVLYAPRPATDGNYGFSVSGAGDVNGDGFADIVVGSLGENRAYVYLSDGTRMNAMPAHTFDGTADGRFGATVYGGFDLNADQHPDLVIGAPRARTSAGTIELWQGTGSGYGFDRTFAGSRANAQLGQSFAAVGYIPVMGSNDGCPVLLAGGSGNGTTSVPGEVQWLRGNYIVGADVPPTVVTPLPGELGFGASVGGNAREP